MRGIQISPSVSDSNREFFVNERVKEKSYGSTKRTIAVRSLNYLSNHYNVVAMFLIDINIIVLPCPLTEFV